MRNYVLNFLSKAPFWEMSDIYFFFEMTDYSYWNQKIYVNWAQRYTKLLLDKLRLSRKSLLCLIVGRIS